MVMLVFLVSWVVATILLGMLGVRSFVDSVTIALIPAVLLGAWVKVQRNRSGEAVYVGPGEPPFQAAYASENVALDVASRRIWLRDVNGRTMTVDLDQIAGWEHTWTDTTNGYGRRSRIRNELSFRLRQLDVPTVRVAFRQFSDAFNGDKNFDEAAEWQARLTTLING
jgi:hypothetical protein